jgi:hypothetical protein
LRLKLTDPSGRGLESRVEFTSEANDYRKTFAPMSVYTAGISAEYEKTIGGIVKPNTVRDSRTGLHEQADLSGGSFDRGGASAKAQYGWGRNSAAVSADGDHTDRDRVNVSVRHELSRFLVPNEQLQQAAGQRQDRDNFETMGMVSYQHVFFSECGRRFFRNGSGQRQRSVFESELDACDRVPEQQLS